MEIREGHNKFYINDEQGKQIAEIVFVPTGENLAIIEHTDVDESLKGQGIGKQLVAKVVCIDSLEVRKKPGGHWIIRDLMGLDLVGLASL